MKSALAFLLSGALTLSGQIVSVGVRVGLPVALQPRYEGLSGGTSHWTTGLTAELHLVSTFSFEADALIRKYSLVTQGGDSSREALRQEVTGWDFPFLLKYHLLRGPTHPFVTAGCSLTHQTYDDVTLTMHSGDPPNSLGPVAGLGVELRYHRARLAPEVRYGHLSLSRAMPSMPNLLTLLLGITF